MQDAGGEVHIGAVQGQGFPEAQPGEVEQQQHRAMHHATQRGAVPVRQAFTRLEEPAAFGAGEDPWDEGRALDVEEAGGRDDRARVLQGEEATQLPQEGEPVGACCLRLLALAGQIGAEQGVSDDRILRVQVGGQEPVQHLERPGFLTIAAAGGPFERQKAVEVRGQGGAKPGRRVG
jgi:hypothetical protein